VEVSLFHDRTTECHLPYGITQCYLIGLPDTSVQYTHSALLMLLLL